MVASLTYSSLLLQLFIIVGNFVFVESNVVCPLHIFFPPCFENKTKGGDKRFP
jgi:hypothetical protein